MEPCLKCNTIPAGRHILENVQLDLKHCPEWTACLFVRLFYLSWVTTCWWNNGAVVTVTFFSLGRNIKLSVCYLLLFFISFHFISFCPFPPPVVRGVFKECCARFLRCDWLLVSPPAQWLDGSLFTYALIGYCNSSSRTLDSVRSSYTSEPLIQLVANGSAGGAVH